MHNLGKILQILTEISNCRLTLSLFKIMLEKIHNKLLTFSHQLIHHTFAYSLCTCFQVRHLSSKCIIFAPKKNTKISAFRYFFLPLLLRGKSANLSLILWLNLVAFTQRY